MRPILSGLPMAIMTRGRPSQDRAYSTRWVRSGAASARARRYRTISSGGVILSVGRCPRTSGGVGISGS